jgi:hypothetical protein
MSSRDVLSMPKLDRRPLISGKPASFKEDFQGAAGFSHSAAGADPAGDHEISSLPTAHRR